jgi:hypothetical protein
MAAIPNGVASLVRGYAILISDSDIYTEEDDDDYGREKEIHTTVKWGFLNSDPKPVQEALGDWGPITATLGGVTAFHGDKFVVLKVDVNSPDLEDMHRFCKETFPNKETHPDYHPHVTLAYLRADLNDPYYYEKYFSGMFEGIELTFDELVFSTGDDEKILISLIVGSKGIAARIAADIRREAMLHLTDVECGDGGRDDVDLHLEWYGTGKLPSHYERALEKFFHTKDKKRIMELAFRSDEVPVLCGRKVFLIDYNTGNFIRRL